MYGPDGWATCMVLMTGQHVWSNCVVQLCGPTVSSNCVVQLRGPTVWSNGVVRATCMVPIAGPHVFSHDCSCWPTKSCDHVGPPVLTYTARQATVGTSATVMVKISEYERKPWFGGHKNDPKSHGMRQGCLQASRIVGNYVRPRPPLAEVQTRYAARHINRTQTTGPLELTQGETVSASNAMQCCTIRGRVNRGMCR